MKSAIWELLLILTLYVVGFGFYRGWFIVPRHGREAATKQIGVSLTVDQGTMNEDAQSVKEKTTELAKNVD